MHYDARDEPRVTKSVVLIKYNKLMSICSGIYLYSILMNMCYLSKWFSLETTQIILFYFCHLYFLPHTKNYLL